jgi:Reverse transcriptase (RNA-dependent DNA polymerase)
MLENYKFKYQTRGKYIYVPNERCIRRGKRLIEYFKKVEFPDYFYHYRSGGHVAALHAHISQRYFFKIDLKNFFYSITRERVFRALRHWHFKPGGNYARWSCVRNPYPNGPQYVLPIGFIQSPLLASLTLMRSPIANAIDEAIRQHVTISVYLDDFIGSHDDSEVLRNAYARILVACVNAHFGLNAQKLTPPTKAIVAFNCDMARGHVEVGEARVQRFFDAEHTPASREAFEKYRIRVANQNFS